MKYKSRRKKHPIFPASLIAKLYFAFLIAFLAMGTYNKIHHKTIGQVHAQGVVKAKHVPLASPTPSITPLPTPYSYNALAAIKRIWGKDAHVGIAIASCESGLRANAVNRNTNGSTDYSIFQVNDYAHRIILDPEENIRFAYSLYTKQGFGPWTSSEKCWKAKL